jgi:hypothetical protein
MKATATPVILLALIGVVLNAAQFQTCYANQGIAPREDNPRKLEPGIKITLKPRKTKYFLGENIVLDYRISNGSKSDFWFNSTTGLGTDDCTVVAVDRAGNQTAASTRRYHCHGSGGLLISPGKSISFTVPLSYYCRLEKPGTYRIRAAHNLHWVEKIDGKTRDLPIVKDDPRWAEATIEVALPDEAQARAVVEEMRRLKYDISEEWISNWETEDYADFTCLQQAVYLPILEKMAADKCGDKRALLGITHNPTPEATLALFRLLKDANEDRAERITAALCDRIPDPEGDKRPWRINPLMRLHAGREWYDFEDADPELVKNSWRKELAAPMRQFARDLLSNDDPIKVQCGAYIFESVATREDVTHLIAAADRLVPIVEKTEPPEYHGHIAPPRQALMDVGYALEALAIRGIKSTAVPKTPGEIILFILAAKQQKSFRPAGWEMRCTQWVRNETPYVREFVLFNTPRPLPDSLLDPYRTAVRKTIASTREQPAIHAAVQSAVEFKVPVDEIMGMLVDRLGSKEGLLYAHIYSCLQDLLETGTHPHAGPACTKPLSEKEMAAFKAGWKEFLKEQGPAIRNGKHFELTSDEIFRLMHPQVEE